MMNDINTRSAESAVRPRVSSVEQRDGAAAAHAETPATPVAGSGNARPVPSAVVITDGVDAQRHSVEQAVAHLNDYVQSLQRDIQFSIDPASQRPVVRVVDRSTQEVIRQIPSETALQLAHDLKAFQSSGQELSAKTLRANAFALFRAQA
jgi:flagellar protein FlaG